MTAGDDARIMPVRISAQGERHRDFRSATDLLSENEWKDWPVRSPRTLGWVCRFIVENGGTPMGRHTKWKSDAKLGTEPGVAEHESACKLLQTLLCYDQLDAGNLAAGELIARQIQMVEEKYKERLQGSSSSSGHPQSDSFLYMGTSLTRGTVCICPALMEFVSGELQKETSILKERRKAREERTLARPKAKQGAHPG